MEMCYKYWCVFRLRKTLKTAAAEVLAWMVRSSLSTSDKERLG
jgi:hypothetical protein